MAFQGSLRELPLPDIIQLVSVSGKTGKFTLSREGEQGLIYLKNGQMTHAQIGELMGEEAIYALAIWNHGDFQFAANEEPERQTITKSNTNLLMEAARRLDEWRILSKKIASIEMIPELLVRENRHEQITINPQEWVIITRIDGKRTIAEIARNLGVSAFDVAKILYGMITSELVQLKKKTDHAGAAAGELIDLASRIRQVAEAHLGVSGQKSVDKHYKLALDRIRSGDGEAAIRSMINEFEKTASLLGGLTMTQQLHAEFRALTTLAL
jgi:hypothetical protein